MQKPTCHAACALSYVNQRTQALRNLHIVPRTHARAHDNLTSQGIERLATPPVLTVALQRPACQLVHRP